MLKLSLKTSGVQIARIVSSFSFIICFAVALSGEYTQTSRQLQTANETAKLKILNDLAKKDSNLRMILGKNSVGRAEEYVDLKAFLESSPDKKSDFIDAKSITKSPLYSDLGERSEANWLHEAGERLAKLFQRNENPTPSFNPPSLGMPGWLVPLAWFLLGGILLAFLIYSLRFIRLRGVLKRKARAVMEDDEPERTLDEWLTLANQYEKEGRYREAVRALYLSCLLKFDEKNIARFLRGQTNWEHLTRIESSPRLPNGIDFRTPTKAFDNVWYGYKVRGAEDVAQFRNWYSDINTALARVAA